MSKFLKKILGVAAIGTAVAGAIYYFKKNQVSDEDFEDEFEDEDFDLDNDLKPVTDREYVSLTPKNTEAKEDGPEESSEEPKAEVEKEQEKETDEGTEVDASKNE